VKPAGRVESRGCGRRSESPRSRRSWFALSLLLFVTGAAWAQAEPEGFPDPGPEVVDREFGVATREFGLDRRVEMYQWRAMADGYQRVWNGAPIDSSGFAPGHENPPALPLQSRRWWAERPTLDGKPIAADVLRTLGEWRVFRPTFTRLPANLAAAFQPEGDGLGSAENPLDPQIGDLRVGWRELVLPPLSGKVELREGVWQVSPRAAAEAAALAAAVARDDPADATAKPGHSWLWLSLSLGVVLAVLVAGMRRRRRSKAQAAQQE